MKKKKLVLNEILIFEIKPKLSKSSRRNGIDKKRVLCAHLDLKLRDKIKLYLIYLYYLRLAYITSKLSSLQSTKTKM